MEKRNFIPLILGSTILFIGILFTSLNIFSDKAEYLITLGSSMFVIGLAIIIKRRRMPKPDEREIKVSRIATSYSWFFTYLIVAIMMFLEQMEITKLQGIHALSIVFFSMAFIQLTSKLLFEKKGTI